MSNTNCWNADFTGAIPNGAIFSAADLTKAKFINVVDLGLAEGLGDASFWKTVVPLTKDRDTIIKKRRMAESDLFGKD